jgi:hypothetical protein
MHLRLVCSTHALQPHRSTHLDPIQRFRLWIENGMLKITLQVAFHSQFVENKLICGVANTFAGSASPRVNRNRCRRINVFFDQVCACPLVSKPFPEPKEYRVLHNGAMTSTGVPHCVGFPLPTYRPSTCPAGLPSPTCAALTTSNSVLELTFGHCHDMGHDVLQGCASFKVRQKKSTGLDGRFVAGCS